MLNLDDFEQTLAARTAKTVAVGGVTFTVEPLSPMVYDAVREVASTRAADPALMPEGLDPESAEHRKVWWLAVYCEEIAAASVIAWTGIENEATAENIRRLVRLSPDHVGVAIVDAAIPPRLISLADTAAVGNA